MNHLSRLLALPLLLLFLRAAFAMPNFLVDADWLAEHIDDEHLVVLEVRYHPHRYYTVGHIPGAVSVVSLDGTDSQSQKWLSDEALTAIYAAIPRDKTIYLYCHDGFRMGLAWMQLKHLGYQDVRLYNGGWSHWGNELTLPVVEGDQPHDEELSL